MKIKDLHRLFLKCTGVATDTRKIEPGSLFFALKGENFNGNTFAADALKAGAKYAVIDETPTEENPHFVLVSDALASLQQLAAFHRQYLGLPIIALTGSNGKTTTKELINACLRKKFNTVATIGNLNNHIGVPLTLLSLKSNTEIAIIEMGANHPGEIAFLCHLAQPDFGYITNFGKAHLEGFKSLEGVIKAKSELYAHLVDNGKTLFLNYDDPVQRKQDRYAQKFCFGTDGGDLHIDYPDSGTQAVIEVEGQRIGSNLIGSYNARNMAAAYSIGRYFNVPKENLKAALEGYLPQNNRSQLIEKGSTKIVMDAYNANPTSMAAAVEAFDRLKEPVKIAILGDMFELGEASGEEHQHLVKKLQASSIQRTFLIGENFYKTQSEGNISHYASFEEFEKKHRPSEFENAIVLVKGSRGMKLERILEFL